METTRPRGRRKKSKMHPKCAQCEDTEKLIHWLPIEGDPDFKYLCPECVSSRVKFLTDSIHRLESDLDRATIIIGGLLLEKSKLEDASDNPPPGAEKEK